MHHIMKIHLMLRNTSVHERIKFKDNLRTVFSTKLRFPKIILAFYYFSVFSPLKFKFKKKNSNHLHLHHKSNLVKCQVSRPKSF